MKLIIIDDEPDARKVLTTFLEAYCPDITIVGEAGNMLEAVALIRDQQPAIVLLDIQLGDQTGFDLLNKFTKPDFMVIFITAHHEFAIKAFQYSALDYLLKPVDPDYLIVAIDKAREAIRKGETYQDGIQHLQQIRQTRTFDKIAVPSAEGLVFIRLADIIYLQSDINYTTFYTTSNEKIVVSKTLKEYEGILPEDSFYRPHQSYILNMGFVKKILKEDGGCALLENNNKIPIARRRKDAFIKLLTRRMIG